MQLRKVTMNFYSSDIAKLERMLGLGWSTEIRERVHLWVKQLEEKNDNRD